MRTCFAIAHNKEIPINTLLNDIPRTAPDRVALTDESRTITYGTLQATVREEAQWLAATGGQRFGILAANGVGWAIADLALHDARRVNVPLPGYFSASQLMHVMADADLDAVVTDQPHAVRSLASGFHVHAVSERTGLTLLRKSGRDNRPAPLPDGTVKVTYTSGSTAEPKGVCLSAAAIEQVARSLADAVAPLHVMSHLCLMPLPTLLENVAGVYASLLSGATCVVPSARTTGMSYGQLNASLLLRSINEANCESLILVPELLTLLVASAESGWRITAPLKFIAVGGATVSPQLLQRAQAIGLPVYEGYGLTECASVVCLNAPGARRAGSVGRPLPHVRIRRDDDGQLHVSGALMSGYLGQRNSAPPSEYATGDLGEIDGDGFVYVRGRLRNLFITSLGRNVSPEWVERELTQGAAIRYAIVTGEARPYAVALICPSGPAVTEVAIAAAVARANERLPDYARIGNWARMPEMPSLQNGGLTSNGRLRREEILKRSGELVDSLYPASPPLAAPLIQSVGELSL